MKVVVTKTLVSNTSKIINAIEREFTHKYHTTITRVEVTNQEIKRPKGDLGVEEYIKNIHLLNGDGSTLLERLFPIHYISVDGTTYAEANSVYLFDSNGEFLYEIYLGS